MANSFTVTAAFSQNVVTLLVRLSIERNLRFPFSFPDMLCLGKPAVDVGRGELSTSYRILISNITWCSA